MKTINRNNHYTPIQMRIQVDLEKIIENSDPIYTFNEIMEQIDLCKYFAEKRKQNRSPKIWLCEIVKNHTVCFYEKRICFRWKYRKYALRIKICSDERNRYSKTDNDATFMRIKRDYMGNDQLLPAYNVRLGICDEYIAVMDMKQYASDMECFVPLSEWMKN